MLSDVKGLHKSTEISILLSLNIYKYHRLSHLLFRHHQNVLVGTILLSLKSCLLSSLFCLPRVNGTFRPLADSNKLLNNTVTPLDGATYHTSEENFSRGEEG